MATNSSRDFWSKVLVGGSDECWPWQGGLTPKGYGRFYIARKVYQAHRFAFLDSGGVLEDGVQVLHDCDNRPCCNPRHLFAGDNTLNMADKVAKTRQSRGERQANAIMTEESVRRLRRLYDLDVPIATLSRMFGITYAQAKRIALRQQWKHVT